MSIPALIKPLSVHEILRLAAGGHSFRISHTFHQARQHTYDRMIDSAATNNTEKMF